MFGPIIVEKEGISDTQGGGHGSISKCRVVSQCISKPINHFEVHAYEVLEKTPLVSVIPKYYGVHSGSIVIADLMAGFDSPCVADLKIGTRHYDLKATEAKIKDLITKQIGSTTDSIGIRVVDAKVRKSGQVAKHWDKKQGLKFSTEEFKGVVQEFIPDSLKVDAKLQVEIILGKLAETRRQNPGFRMYASSVLIGYDGDHLERGIRFCLIDFAHTFLDIVAEGGKADDASLEDNVLLGVRNLANFI